MDELGGLTAAIAAAKQAAGLPPEDSKVLLMEVPARQVAGGGGGGGGGRRPFLCLQSFSGRNLALHPQAFSTLLTQLFVGACRRVPPVVAALSRFAGLGGPDGPDDSAVSLGASANASLLAAAARALCMLWAAGELAEAAVAAAAAAGGDGGASAAGGWLQRLLWLQQATGGGGGSGGGGGADASAAAAAAGLPAGLAGLLAALPPAQRGAVQHLLLDGDHAHMLCMEAEGLARSC